MHDTIKLNVPFLRMRVPNLTVAAREVGLRPATVSNLCTGKIPLGGAEVRTLVALANLAGCTVDELIIRETVGDMIETGIKVIDLFAPIVRGGNVGFIAREGIGQFVLMAELVHRLKNKGFFTVLWTTQTGDEHPNLRDITSEVDKVCKTAEAVSDSVSGESLGKDVFLVTDRETLLSGKLAAAEEQFDKLIGKSVTIALIDTYGEAANEDNPFGPLETVLRFDTDLAVRGLYPAIDPLASTSILHEDAQVSEMHLKLQQQARKALRLYRESRGLVNLRGMQALKERDVAVYHSGEQLEAFLTQRFYIAEPYTHESGTWVSLSETLRGVDRLLRREDVSDKPLDDLLYIGGLASEEA